jgi:ribosomal protein L34E
MERPEYTFECSICGLTLDQIPSDALEISRSPNSRTTMYQFGGTSTSHAIRKKRKQAASVVEEKDSNVIHKSSTAA